MMFADTPRIPVNLDDLLPGEYWKETEVIDLCPGDIFYIPPPPFNSISYMGIVTQVVNRDQLADEKGWYEIYFKEDPLDKEVRSTNCVKDYSYKVLSKGAEKIKTHQNDKTFYDFIEI